MTLKSYLDGLGDHQVRDFARRLKVDWSTVWRWANTETVPSKRNLKRILAATEGAVTPADFYSFNSRN
jgi:hypothetical protein